MTKISTIKPEFIFLFFCLIFGSIFTVITSPFAVPDEDSHFYKAFDVSQGHIIPESNVITVPKSIVNISHTYQIIFINKLSFHTVPDEDSHFYKAFDVDLNKHLNVNDREKLDITNIYKYTPLPYLAFALVIKIGELFNLSPLLLMYLGRLINLLIYCIIVYYAIKIIPIQKYTLLLIALTPMTLFEAASLSADSFNMAISFFTIALFLNLALTQTKIQKKEIILLSISIICLILSKQIYALIALLFFIIPKDKFESMTKRLINFIYIILPASITIMFWNYLIKTYTLITKSSDSSNLLLINPLNFLTIINNTLLTIFESFVTWIPIIVPPRSTISNPLGSFLVFSYLIVLIIVSTLCTSKLKLKLKQKTICLVTFSLLAMIIFLIAFDWTPPGSQVISGVQGRYFTPITPLLFLIFYNSEKISKYLGKKYLSCLKCFVIMFIVLMLIISTYILYWTSICYMFIN